MKKKLIKNSFFKTATILKKAKTTTALTCLIGTMLFTQNAESQLTTTTGSLVVSTSVASTCTVAAGAMTFAAYAQSTITAFSTVTVNCTNGTTYTVSFNDTPPGIGQGASSGSVYFLVRSGGSSATSSDRLEVSFTNGSSTMTNAAATITGTGTGSSSAAGTITGTIAGSQTGKTAGSYSQTITLNIVY